MKPILSPKTFFAYSLGCRVNQAEIETISKQLTDYGLKQFRKQLTGNKEQSPDLVLLNTCVVTTKAERETRKEVRKLRKLYPKSFLVVTGCGPTAKIKYPEADLVVTNENKKNIIGMLVETFDRTSLQKTSKIYTNPYIQSGRKFIKIQEGCDKFCSFCLTAYLRGRPQSRPVKEIIEEINNWVNRGIKEVILTGINIALYGQDLKEQETMNSLLEKILQETSVERITLSSIYPEMLTTDFINLVIKNPRISRVFHLSIQSGSQTVLKRMNRKTAINELTDYLLFIKKAIPEFTFRADIIAGFPGETENEFEETLDFIKKVKISFVHVFPYSKRKGTAAYSLPDLPASVKKARVKRIQEVVKEIRNNEAKNLIAKLLNCSHCKCLIVRGNQGITENGWLIKISSKYQVASSKGEIVPIKITAFKNDQLLGEILSLPK